MLLIRHPVCKDVVCIISSIKGGVTRWPLRVWMIDVERITVTLSKEETHRGKVFKALGGFILELRRKVNSPSSSLSLGFFQ